MTDDAKRRAIIALVTKLRGHYFVPDFTPGLADALMHDWVDDLDEFTVAAIEHGCNAWRRSPAKHFPTSGQLIPLIRNAPWRCQFENHDETERAEIAARERLGIPSLRKLDS